MQCTRKLLPDLYWVGANDRRLSRFENIFPIPRGVSYNSYVLLDEKTVLLDTVDHAVGRQFFENVAHVLGERKLDYVVLNHMEPDHCALLEELLRRHPEATVVGNAKTFQMIGQFFDLDLAGRSLTVAENSTLETGRHTLRFFLAPMVHWPEVMVTYDEATKALFSADAFGTFGALPGSVFADEVDFERDWLDDARRYYANIVGKYGGPVQMLLKKVCPRGVSMLLPLHGPVWRENVDWFVGKYDLWSRYEPEEKGVVIAYASMYGNTESAANALSALLAERGVRKIAVYDVSGTNISELISEFFRCSHIVLAAPTYNGGLYPPMEALLLDAKALSVQKRTVALMENGTWAPAANMHMRKMLDEMKNMTVLEPAVSIRSSMRMGEMLGTLADAIAASLQA
ncbi:MAG TPA: FprA family A-type flavoprotein [Oscillospiraceae bacterium]|nr:FprA family A-type flavoprotein [Oscillospiraceae bacterium]